nr:L,D-transpeptidase family protein [Roseomonas acroporae]
MARLRARAAAAATLPTVPTGPTLEPGTEEPVRIPALRARLAAEDPVLAAAPDGGPLYDAALEESVRRFQATEGLEADGRVGAITVAALNRSYGARIRQLRVALDMRRNAAAPPAGRRVEVNIPDFRAQVIENGRVLFDMAVIVGRPTRQTPTMRTTLTAAVFNPQWGVPVRLAREDLLPRFRRDPRGMQERGFRVYANVDGEARQVDATTINWGRVDPASFPYTIRQAAGDDNALGRLKLVMPNNQDIYMHDTPERALFARADRAFSSGCIRMEQPFEMLNFVLAGTPGWSAQRGQQVLASRATTSISAAYAMPVRLHYTTVVVEGGRVARIRPDLYGLDEAYARLLDAPRDGSRSRPMAGPPPATATPPLRTAAVAQGAGR